MDSFILRQTLSDMLKEDLGLCDITSSRVPNKKVRAEIVSHDSGVVSGVSEVEELFKLVDVSVVNKIPDGKSVKKNERVMLLEGMSRRILVSERTALNILSRMSGISTMTRLFVECARSVNPKVRVASTRKTTPLFRFFEKTAVEVGGGDTHRLGLSDMVLIKDNHVRLFKNVGDAVRKVKAQTSFAHKVEVEVRSMAEALSAVSAGADVVMFDNMSPKEISRVVAELGKQGVRDGVLLEASGGITLDNVRDFASTGVDVLSAGCLTSDAPSIDFSLELV